MRIFQDFGEAISEVRRDVVELGFEVQSESVQNIQEVGDDYLMKEIIGYSYMLTDTRGYAEVPNLFTPADMLWLSQEHSERIRFRRVINPGTAWKNRKEVWKPFLNSDGRFDYTYNRRMRVQLPRVIAELITRPHTRQAVIQIFRSTDSQFFGGKKRIPCSLSYQFIIRRGKLNMIYNMRSCDVMTHFPFDVALACMLLNWMAGMVKAKRGTLTHTIGSLHCFKKDAKEIF